ncbi:MAG: magnesium transporter CorA family protein [Pseudonocardiales bacterium]|nr:magnesium transporter CorA family protein [Pseudonocardiales bacterium]
MTRTRRYRSGVLEAEDFPVADIAEHLGQPGVTVWLDLCAPDTHDLAMISKEFDLHQLAVEDAGQERQRPKLDRYESHLFVTAYSVSLNVATGALETFEVAVFVTRTALVTVRKSDQFDINGVVARWDASPDLAKHGVSFLLHGLLDYVVDGHFAAVQTLDDEIEALEDLLFDDDTSDLPVQRRSFELRKSLVQLRRVVLPMREVVNSLMRRDLRLFDEAMTPYYQDVYDHVLRATEWTESLRDLVTTILETNLTIQGNRLNVITKKVTSWAAIIAVPTAITGFYGQNVPYPGFGQESGFYVSTISILVISVALYILFRWRDWI